MDYVINVGYDPDELAPVSGCLDVEHGKLLIEAKYMEYPYQEICYSPEDLSADEVVWDNFRRKH
jgi:hypothetical protein